MVCYKKDCYERDCTCRGKRGKRGCPGEDGAQGPPGQDGAQGPPGQDVLECVCEPPLDVLYGPPPVEVERTDQIHLEILNDTCFRLRGRLELPPAVLEENLADSNFAVGFFVPLETPLDPQLRANGNCSIGSWTCCARKKTSEITQVETVAASSLNNTYFLVNAVGVFDEEGDDTYYVWYNVDGAGTDPKITDPLLSDVKFGIQVNLDSLDVRFVVATKTATAVDAFGDFIASAKGNVVTIVSSIPGPVEEASAGTSGFTVTVPVKGGSPPIGFGISNSGSLTLSEYPDPFPPNLILSGEAAFAPSVLEGENGMEDLDGVYIGLEIRNNWNDILFVNSSRLGFDWRFDTLFYTLDSLTFDLSGTLFLSEELEATTSQKQLINLDTLKNFFVSSVQKPHLTPDQIREERIKRLKEMKNNK